MDANRVSPDPGQGRREGVLVAAFQSEREEKTRDRAERGSAVRGFDQASAGARLRARAKRNPLPTDRAAIQKTQSSKLFLGHERVAIICRRRESLFDIPRTDPAHEIQLRPRLIVRTRPARASERLLPHHGARRFVVDVEIAGGIPEREIGRASCRERV